MTTGANLSRQDPGKETEVHAKGREGLMGCNEKTIYKGVGEMQMCQELARTRSQKAISTPGVEGGKDVG